MIKDLNGPLERAERPSIQDKHATEAGPVKSSESGRFLKITFIKSTEIWNRKIARRIPEFYNFINNDSFCKRNPELIDSYLSTCSSSSADSASPEQATESKKCCELGMLAASHGFHCYAHFYAKQVLKRNENRPQNRRIFFRSRLRPGMYGLELMSRFEQCIPRNSDKFYSCCKAETRKIFLINSE